ncbi:putative bifunctional diguanylate cyclase/phosphodiesterase [Alkalimonas amylolytica]|uniref:Diguanylate cyclase (GGDEF) domain-containing protein n=1 Tax=Alkalimonas amylolytica TaxID=152573 RepID=A0A1H3Y9A5_ALKAM|nr:EAL domain-containing protein [Alkalimonas amylolytica]SEA08186.1 diguanylate cyclase (GGDEF) domain-containing protein [Alkalimonas amylolytica]
MSSDWQPNAIQAQASEPQSIQLLRVRRLLQISGATLFGLLLAMSVASGMTQWMLLLGSSCLAIAFLAAWKQRPLLAAYVLLWSMALMLTGLALVSGGIRDLAVVGYPGVLVFAAILGSRNLFLSLLSFILLAAVSMGYASMQGWFTPFLPDDSWRQVLYVSLILSITGFSVLLMAQDLHRSLRALQAENKRVRDTQQQLQRLAMHDKLTDLPNRTLCEELFRTMQAQCLQQQQRLALLFLDLDNFKPVNDALGHAAGDVLLQQLAERLQSELSTQAVLCRFGGDEFMVLCPADADDAPLADLADRLLKQTTEPFTLMQTKVEVSGSIGIVSAPTDGIEFHVLCRKVDLAMYSAKEQGRNTWRFYSDVMDQANTDKFNLLQRIRDALKNNEFKLYYQPKIDLQHQQVQGAEALLRWPQNDGSFINPAEVIELAEYSGLILELGAWVLQQACNDCQQWRQLGFPDVKVAVNLSPIQFRDGRLEHTVLDALRQSGLPPSALELELTESLLIDNSDFVQQQLSSLGALGISFAIDDFGTGYSNLGYLRQFNASSLKVDKSFISSLSISLRDEPLVRAIIQLAKSLELSTVAEGVEDDATFQLLKQLGCDAAQGYLWSAALPPDQFTRYLQKQR